ncbi:MAG: mannose-1-phosphate guanylyltransferase [Candidatus Shapirobacteria bacterium]
MEKTPKQKHCILILCGGTGPRLWPLSRANNPKQFLSLFGKESLLEETVKRALKITSKDNIFIISNKNYFNKIAKICKNIPKKNIISEPIKKNTALAILYATAYIKNINPNAIISSLPSDHYIKNVNKFKIDLIKAKNLAKNNDSIITIGIKATSPDTSYGYIVPQIKTKNYSTVSTFIEKPEINNAQKLIKKQAFWNSGIYTFSIKTIESEFKNLNPNYYKDYLKIETNLNNPKKIIDVYLSSQELPIDRAISEKSKNILVIPASFDWSDVGEWENIFLNLPKNKDGQASITKDTPILSVKSSDCLVSGLDKKIVGLVGVKDLAIIDTPDALLICNLKDSFKVRDLVTLIVKNKKLEPYFLKKK